MRADRRGTILFEVMVGLTVLTIATLGWVTLLAQTRVRIAEVRDREARYHRASELLQRYRYYAAEELDGRLGTTRWDSLAVTVASEGPHLYSLAVSDLRTRVIVLNTTIYARPAADTARQ